MIDWEELFAKAQKAIDATKAARELVEEVIENVRVAREAGDTPDAVRILSMLHEQTAESAALNDRIQNA